MDVLRTTIQREFRNLQSSDIEQLFQYTWEIYEFALKKFAGRLPPLNNTRDAMAWVFLLLPYIDEANVPRIASMDQIFRQKSPYCNVWVDSNVSLETSRIAIKETIIMASNKLIADGIHFFPVPLGEMKKTPLFIQDTDWIQGNIDAPGGLWVGDYFNTIVNDLYRNIRSCKFLLYEIKYDENVGYIYSFEDVIHAIFHKRENAWEETLQNIKFSDNIGIFSHAQVIQVLRYAIVFFDNYFSENDLPPAYQGILGKKLGSDDEDKDEDYTNRGIENKDISEIPEEAVHTSLHQIGMVRWYSYLADCQNKLRRTYYWQDPTQPLQQQMETSIPTVSNLYGKFHCPLTRKHIYLFAKNIYLFLRERFVQDPGMLLNRPLWSKINKATRSRILPYLLGMKSREDFLVNIKYRITPTLQRFFQQSLSKNDAWNMSLYSYLMIIKLLPEIVHTTLIRKGVLSMYQPNFSTKKTQDTFSFIDGSPLPDNVENNVWPRVYPTNWIQQLSVFHRIYHSRITLVTGGTGVGKSRHSPKLFFYAMMMMMYNSTPRMVCTQPRINPTKNTAFGLAEDLGCPIIEKNNKKKKTRTEPETETEIDLLQKKYFIQYKYSEESYVPKPDRDIGYIRVSTDGSFLELIRMNATLLTSLIPGTTKNVVDVVLIDEAHEHNTNMDLIISIMREALRYNPNIKLIIVSATMDEDELRYRQFFQEFSPTIDRRIHLAEYGKPNLYKITEHYEPEAIRTFEDAENAGIQKVLDLTNQKESGDILFFSLGESDITRTINLLNESLPPSWIALPFFSKLPKTYQQIFNNFEEESRRLLLPKNDLIPYIQNFYGIAPRHTSALSTSSYKKFIIVATNIAEASITIDSLKVVVDTGFVKLARYNPRTGSSDLQPLPITNSSRIQRRGRVGRKSDGDVYFLYAKDSRPNKQRFNITNENIIPRFLLQGAYIAQPPRPTLIREGNNEISIAQLMDPLFIFHFIHPMEDKITRRNDYSVQRQNHAKPGLGTMNDHMSILTHNVVCHNMLLSGILPALSRRISLEELSVLDLIALLLAHNHGRSIFQAVARVIISVRIHLVPCEIFFRGGLEISSTTINLTNISPRTLKQPEKIESTIEFLWRQIAMEKSSHRPKGLSRLQAGRFRVTLTYGSTREEIAALCLYHAAPINLGTYEGSQLINAFYQDIILLPPKQTRKAPTKYFVYLASVNNTCQHLYDLPADAIDKQFLFSCSMEKLQF